MTTDIKAGQHEEATKAVLADALRMMPLDLVEIIRNYAAIGRGVGFFCCSLCLSLSHTRMVQRFSCTHGT